jgi:hypothetical protein
LALGVVLAKQIAARNIDALKLIAIPRPDRMRLLNNIPDLRRFRHLPFRGAAALRGLAGWLAAGALASVAHAQAQSVPQSAAQAAAGATVETAIALPNIADEFHGVAAEHGYIAKHFSDWHIENQATFEQNGRRYDRLGMAEPDGTKTAIYFDITDWFGK